MKDYRQKQGFKDHFIDEPFLEALDEWVWEMDLNGIHTYSNAAVEKILGFKVEEIVGFSTTKLWPRIDNNNNETNLKKTLATGKGWKNYPAYFIHKEGTIRILLSSAIPVYNQEGKLLGYRGIDRDITERVLNERALDAQKEHVKLINQILRHDLTNDLTKINSALRLFDEKSDKQYLAEIKGVIGNSVKLIRSMSELETYIMENKDYKVFNSDTIFNRIIKDRNDVKITVKGNSLILADEMVYSIFGNLINNAVQHGKAEQIDISVKNEGPDCFISFFDNGSGIPDKIKTRLFEKGFTYGENGHTGIGLHIVKQAMEKYRGAVEVTDNKPRGTVFRLRFKRMG